jgi:hypothetical protein
MEIYPFLLRMCQHYCTPPEQFAPLYARVKARTFGHLSGGIDREGRDFLTVYYGVKGYAPPDHESRRGRPKKGSLLPTGLCLTPSVRWPLLRTERTGEKASLLRQLIDNLNVRCGFERSFKISERTPGCRPFPVGLQETTTLTRYEAQACMKYYDFGRHRRMLDRRFPACGG